MEFEAAGAGRLTRQEEGKRSKKKELIRPILGHRAATGRTQELLLHPDL